MEICEICKQEFERRDGTGGDHCPRCGATYDYDEGYMLIIGEVVSFDLDKGEATFKIKRDQPKQGE